MYFDILQQNFEDSRRVIACSQAWVEPDTHAMGEAFVWGATALPVIAIFLLLNIMLGGMAFAAKRLDWLFLIGGTTIVWVAAFIYDNAHHGIKCPLLRGLLLGSVVTATTHSRPLSAA